MNKKLPGASLQFILWGIIKGNKGRKILQVGSSPRGKCDIYTHNAKLARMKTNVDEMAWLILVPKWQFQHQNNNMNPCSSSQV